MKAPAVDAEASAAAARIDEQGSALGSYWDPERSELAVVVGPDSTIGEEEAKKLVGGAYRLERLDIAKKTVDSIREQIADSTAGRRSSRSRATWTCTPDASSWRRMPPPR